MGRSKRRRTGVLAHPCAVGPRHLNIDAVPRLSVDRDANHNVRRQRIPPQPFRSSGDCRGRGGFWSGRRGKRRGRRCEGKRRSGKSSGRCGGGDLTIGRRRSDSCPGGRDRNVLGDVKRSGLWPAPCKRTHKKRKSSSLILYRSLLQGAGAVTFMSSGERRGAADR